MRNNGYQPQPPNKQSGAKENYYSPKTPEDGLIKSILRLFTLVCIFYIIGAAMGTGFSHFAGKVHVITYHNSTSLEAFNDGYQ